jgi:uncharacterized protein
VNTLAEVVERDMRNWLERAVIGLNLCPFAKAVHSKGQVHFAISPAEQAEDLLQDLEHELHDLVALASTERDTTLLVAPRCLQDFLDFNDFLGIADRALRRLRLEGVIQIASFHPDYQFADAAKDDITNYTNRAPYPTLHLLREESIDKAVAAFPEPEAIFEQNMRTLQALGPGGWAALDVGPSAAGRIEE